VYKTEINFRYILIGAIAVKLTLAFLLPITSDEAYYHLWGLYPDINYYDHPPVIGWLLALFGLLGNHIFISRLISILSGLLVALGIYCIVRYVLQAPQKAKLICLAFIAAPLHMLSILITTDAPLFLFTALSGFTFICAVQRQSDLLVLLSGAFLGLAILSKYFAGLLLIAVCAYLIIERPRHWFKYGLIWIAGAVPFVALHIYGNYQSCWTNVLFNVVNRNKSVSWQISGLLTFILFQIYLATPWVAFYLLKSSKAIWVSIQKNSRFFVYLFGIPLVVLGFVAGHHSGLHWALAFFPFMFGLFVQLPRAQINRIVIISMIFSGLHIVPAMTVLALPGETFKSHHYYRDLVICKYGDELFDQIKTRFGSEYIWGTNGYYTSGVMTYHSGEHFIVFLDDSKYGRLDDKLTDFREFEGKDILIVSTLPFKIDYGRFFNELVSETHILRHNKFFVNIGKGFDYITYRDIVLRKAYKDWYTRPGFLPKGKCYFEEKYFQTLDNNQSPSSGQ
jgi:hypothetical protein